MNDLARTSLMFVVGLAGGLTGALLFGGDPGPASSGNGLAQDGGEERTIRALEERLLALEGATESQRLAYDELDGRLLALSRRPDFEQIMAAADAAAAAASSPSAAFGPAGLAVEAETRAVIERYEAEKEAERQAEQAKRRDERIAAQAERVSTELGLDVSQAKVVHKAISESWTAREAIFAEMRDGGGGQPLDREAIGQKMSELRAIEIETVSKVLTPAQVEQYSSLTSFGRGFGGDAGRGRNEGDRGGRSDGGRGGF